MQMDQNCKQMNVDPFLYVCLDQLLDYIRKREVSFLEKIKTFC